MLAFVLLGAWLDPQAAAPAARAAEPSELKVVVAAPVYQPNGALTVETATLSSAGPSVVHVFGRRTICNTATAGATEPADASFGWRLASRTISASESEVVVSVDWQRVWDRGQRIANGPSGTVQLTLHPGDRIALDHIPNPVATDACRAVGIGLEVKLARTAAPAPVGSALLPMGAVEGGRGVLDADLWLVHTPPAGIEHAQHVRLRLTPEGSSFGFPAVTYTTPQGDVMVEINGSFRRYRAPTGGEFLYVSIARTVSGGAAPPGGISGGTGTVMALPVPADVLSLEIPASAPGRGGQRGGGGARGGMVSAVGGGGRGGGTAVAAPGSATGAPATVAGGSGTFVAAPRGGGGGGGVGTPGPEQRAAVMGRALVTTLLEGHTFSLRLRVTPVPGS